MKASTLTSLAKSRRDDDTNSGRALRDHREADRRGEDALLKEPRAEGPRLVLVTEHHGDNRRLLRRRKGA